tara:strand:- start:732 stop:851 length:120 start_codon:yes stop_codon:yes gene_type:complete
VSKAVKEEDVTEDDEVEEEDINVEKFEVGEDAWTAILFA